MKKWKIFGRLHLFSSIPGLIDDDLTDDLACVALIYARHGFTAWNAWKAKCQGSLEAWNVDECF